MNRRMTIIGLTAYVISCSLAVLIYSGPIEKKLQAEADQILAAAIDSDPAFEGAEIAFDNMHGKVRGLHDAAAAGRLRTLVLSSLKAGALEVELEPPPLEFPEFEMRPGESGNWILTGKMPDLNLVNAIRSKVGDEVDSSGLVRGHVMHPGWLDHLPQLVSDLAQFQGTLQIKADRVVIGGRFPNLPARDTVMELAAGFWGDSVEDKTQTPGWLEISRGDQDLVIAGVVGSGDEKQRLESTLQRGLGTAFSGEISESPDTYMPEWMPETAVALCGEFDRLSGGLIRLDWRALTVEGVVLGKAGRDELLAALGESLPPGLQIEEALEVKVPPTLSVGKVGEDIRLLGLLPNEEMVTEVVGAIQQRFPLIIGINREELQVDAAAMVPDWLQRAREAIPDVIDSSDTLLFEISDSGINILGTVRSAAAKDRLLKLAEQISGGVIPVENGGINVLAAPELTVTMSKEKITLSGKLSEGHKRALTENFRKYLTTVEIKNEIGTAGEVWDPEWISAAGEAIPEFLQMASELGDARVVIDEKSLKAEASFPSDELKEVVEQLFIPFRSAGLQLDLAIQILPQPRLIIQHKEGMISLAGRLNAASTKKKFLRAMKSQFPGAEVDDRVMMDNGAAESGWDDIASTLISDVMRELANPGIDLRPGKLRVEGIADNEPMRKKLEGILLQNYGAEFDIESAIKLPDDFLEDPRLELAREEDGSWVLSGLVSSDDEKDAIMDAAKDAGLKRLDSRNFNVSSEVRPAPWAAELGPVLSIMADAKEPWISVQRGEMAAEGIFSNNAARQKLKDAGSKLSGLAFEDWTRLPDSGPEVVVPPPPDLQGD